MSSKRSPPDEVFYERIDEVLHYVWDPIGVSGVAAARNEYQSYVPAILGLLKDGADAERIAAHLNDITSKRMGLNEDGKKALVVARLLLSWKKALLESQSLFMLAAIGHERPIIDTFAKLTLSLCFLRKP